MLSREGRAAELNAHESTTRGNNSMSTSMPHLNGTNRCVIATIVYFALLLDNVLLTVIVPILPSYLASLDNQTYIANISAQGSMKPLTDSVVPQQLAYRHVVSEIGGGNGGGIATHLVGMTKHPIPGKSMVNFTLLQLMNDDKQQTKMAMTTLSPLMTNPTSRTTTTTTITNNSNIGNSSSTTLLLLNRHSSGINAAVVNTAGTLSIESLARENGSIGLLLAMKALVQLIFNPIVGNMSSKVGYRLPIVVGTFCLLISSLVFAIGESYLSLLLARAIQGIGSACIGVCGMSLVAQNYPEEGRRSKVMGIILGSIALGVLLGYPFGGILYDLLGKSSPFIILSTIIFLNLGMQMLTMDLSVQPEVALTFNNQEQPKWRPLLESKMILAIVVAIWFSTSTMAILEPCLPIWLIQYLKPTKWQLGTVFIPDSVGYFVGTNFFGAIAYKYGQVKVSCICLLLVGIASITIPSATTMTQLLLPHFILGLGIGVIDASLVPLLATFVDATLTQDENAQQDTSSSTSSYGTVYAIQQTSVSLAYCLAPLIGGELAQTFGFAWLMRIVGFFNIIYGPVLVYLYAKYDPKTLREQQNDILLRNSGRGSQYKQLYNSMDIE